MKSPDVSNPMYRGVGSWAYNWEVRREGTKIIFSNDNLPDSTITFHIHDVLGINLQYTGRKKNLYIDAKKNGMEMNYVIRHEANENFNLPQVAYDLISDMLIESRPAWAEICL